jgi:hypothetical protein
LWIEIEWYNQGFINSKVFHFVILSIEFCNSIKIFSWEKSSN